MKKQFSFLTIALGCWLIALALTFGYAKHFILISDLMSGLLFVLFGVLSMAPQRVWPGWAVGVVGMWLQMAPLLFWAPQALMYFNDTLVGAIGIVFAFQLAKQAEPVREIFPPAGWSYNPSGWEHRIPTVALAMLCWFFSRYMAAYQLGYIDHVWDPFFKEGTLRVITSTISRSFPVSDAGLGAVCYTLEFLLGWQGSSQRWSQMPWLVFAFAFLVIPVGIVSVTLIILQPVAVGAWCSWCLATASCMLLMIILTAGELVGVVQFLAEVRQRKGSVWLAFWKGGTPKRDPMVKSMQRFFLGVTAPWNLALSVILGIWLMASPALLHIQSSLAICNYVAGPMIAAISVIAFAEVFRIVRYGNILLGAALIVGSWAVSGSFATAAIHNTVIGLLVIALCFRKGQIIGRYGAWEQLIR
jgi:hypothetical protein